MRCPPGRFIFKASQFEQTNITIALIMLYDLNLNALPLFTPFTHHFLSLSEMSTLEMSARKSPGWTFILYLEI